MTTLQSAGWSLALGPGPAMLRGQQGPRTRAAKEQEGRSEWGVRPGTRPSGKHPCGLSGPPCPRTTQAFLGAHLRQGQAPHPRGQRLVSAFLAQPCSPWGPGGESSSREWEGVMSGPGGVTVLDEGPLAALRLSGCRCTLRMDRVGRVRSGDAAGSHSTLGLARRRDEPSFSHRLSPSSLPPGPSSLRLVELQLPDWPPGGARLPTRAGPDRQAGASPSRAPGSIPGAGSRAPGLPPDWGRVQDAL